MSETTKIKDERETKKKKTNEQTNTEMNKGERKL